MKSRPILFSAPMVRALLAGTKTQTRRIVKPQPDAVESWVKGKPSNSTKAEDVIVRLYNPTGRWKNCNSGWGADMKVGPFAARCPGQVGNRLWVRETWGHTRQCDDINGPGDVIAYAAGGEHVYEDVGGKRRLRLTQRGAVMKPNHFCWPPKPWKPSIHMPRWASRITLEITGVRVERLQGISEADALAEGVSKVHHPFAGPNGVDMFHVHGAEKVICADTARSAFGGLWESINGPGSWDANPWVWVVEFKRVAP